MLFRSRKFSKQIRAQNGLDTLKNITSKMLGIWQNYNDTVFRFHVLSLSHLLKDGGVMIIATDVEKRFAAPEKDAIYSFTSEDLPDVPKSASCLDLQYKHDSITWWVDQPFDLPITIEQIPVEYFLAHKHRVSVAVYSKKSPQHGGRR